MRYPWKSTLAVLAAAAALTALPAAAQTARVLVNDREVYFRDQGPVERDGRVYIPLRGVLERIGAETVQWRPERGEVFVANGPREILLHIGDTKALVDGREVWLDAPPILMGERTMVPLRFVSENMGATVRWDGATRTVYVSVPQERIAGRRETYPADRPENRETPPRRERPPDRELGLAIRPLRPIPGEAVSTLRPEIAVVLRSPVQNDIDYDSIRMWINGEDVTRQLEIGVNSVTYRPTDDLDRGVNRVQLTVRDRDGHTVTRDWSFRVR
jgi:hypothetical protein